MAWKAFNSLLDDPRLLVLDSRPARAFLDRHIKGSICVRIASNGSTLEHVAGPGPPAWSQDCWWGRNVLVVSPIYTSESKMLKDMQLDSGTHHFRKRKRPRHSRDDRTEDGVVDEVIKFLLSENRVKSLKILEIEDDKEKDSYSAFAKRYPFLVTRSQKAAVVSGYPTEVVPRLLYLGDLENVTAERNLEDLQITHVLTIHTEPVTLSKGFVQLFFELADESKADITQYFERMFQFVEDARKSKRRVLVHCGAGASRSATLCAAYLMRVNQWKADFTLKFLKQQRRQVDPNPGFLQCLYEYERELGLAFPEESASDRIGENMQSRTQPNIVEAGAPLIFDVLKEGTVLGTLAFPESNVIICGRGAMCDLVLDHASISRQHAKLEYAGQSGASIRDLDSVHGTFVNNMRLAPATKQQLHVGDVVTFGASTRRYVLRYGVT
ncbi:unnamed protein product [Calypogeia fissa]